MSKKSFGRALRRSSGSNFRALSDIPPTSGGRDGVVLLGGADGGRVLLLLVDLVSVLSTAWLVEFGGGALRVRFLGANAGFVILSPPTNNCA